VAAEIKFCGLTRAEDVQAAVSLGCSYVGVIFAGGPRAIEPEHAAMILDGVPASVQRVGVFADQDASTIAAIAHRLDLRVVQLHAGADGERIADIRRYFEGAVWPVVRLDAATLPPDLKALYDAAGIVHLDAHVPGALGGTGVALAWEALAGPLGIVRQRRRLVLAGGLRPGNVGEAIRWLAPDVVDVSSGVERSPGVKDHSQMRAFRDAVNVAGEHQDEHE
jgi:phosphoribosylanthranilate isomerase